MTLDFESLASALHQHAVPFVWLDAGLHEKRSFLGFDPLETIEGSDFSVLDRCVASSDDLPVWFGYVAYEAWHANAAGIGVRMPMASSADVLISFTRYRHVLAFEDGVCSGSAAAIAAARAMCSDAQDRSTTGRARVHGVLQCTPREVHAARVALALRAIVRGDFYQVNLARRFSFLGQCDPLSLYLAMRKASPVPFGAYFSRANGQAILSCSMELFLRWQPRTGAVHTRPIKGTICDSDGARDVLLADPKERAEHAMIVDLLRNDLAKVSEVGSVQVRDLFAVERYRKLLHLVSTVEAKTRPDVMLSKLLCELFPPGSISGTPKSTALAFIDETEDFRRGVYCGAMGYFGGADGLCLSVAIRTAIASPERIDYFAGGGIVAASVPEREVAETELKAAVFFDALQALGFDSRGL